MIAITRFERKLTLFKASAISTNLNYSFLQNYIFIANWLTSIFIFLRETLI